MKTRVIKAARLACKQILYLPSRIWDLLYLVSNGKKYLSKYTKQSRKVIVFSQLLSLCAGVWLVRDITTSMKSVTNSEMFPTTWCTSTKPWPTILFCPKPFGTRKYGLIANETLIKELGLTDADVDILSEYKMTGVDPSKKKKAKLEEKFGKTLDELWLKIINLKMSVDYEFKPERSAIECDHMWPIHGGPGCIPERSYKVQSELNDFCPFYDWHTNSSVDFEVDYSNAGKPTRRIWHTELKSRCAFMEKGTHSRSHYVYLTWISGFGSEIQSRFWFWFGDLNTTSVDSPSQFDEGEGKVSYRYDLFRIKKASIPRKAICQTKLQYDGGIKYPCPKQQFLTDYWVYQNYGMEPLNHARLTADEAAVRMIATVGILYEDVAPFTTMGLVYLSVGTVDFFVGLSLYHIISLLLDLLKKKHKKIKFGLELSVITALGLSAVGLVFIEWKASLDNAYLSTVTNEEGTELDIPNLLLGSDSDFQNYTKYKELDISVPFLDYLEVGGNWRHVFSKSRSQQYPSSTMLEEFTQNCQQQNLTNGCIWDLSSRYINLLLPFEFSPHDEEVFNSVTEGLKLAYANRYKSIVDYQSLLTTMEMEYRDVVNHAVAMGHNEDDLLSADGMKKFLALDTCQLILSCSVAGTMIEGCCKAFEYFPDGTIQFYNNAEKHGVPVMSAKRAGINSGLTLRINITLLHQHGVGAFSSWNGGFKKGIFKNIQAPSMILLKWNSGVRALSEYIDGEYSVPYSKLSDHTLNIGLALVKAENTYIFGQRNQEARCFPYDPHAHLLDYTCDATEILKQFAALQYCGCRLCSQFYGYKPWKNVPCCKPLDSVKCITHKGAYRFPCIYTDPGTTRLVSHRKPMNEFLTLVKDCHYGQWKERDSGSQVVELFNEANRKNLTEMLGGYDFFNQNPSNKFFQPMCYSGCTDSGSRSVGEAFWTQQNTDPGVLEIHVHYATMSKRITRVTAAFDLWQSIALTYGTWSVIFNQPILVILVALWELLNTVYALLSGKITLSSLFKDDENPTDMILFEKNKIHPGEDQEKNETKPSGSKVDGPSDTIEMDDMAPTTSKRGHGPQFSRTSITEMVNEPNVSHAPEETDYGILTRTIFGIIIVVGIASFAASSYNFIRDSQLKPTATITNISNTEKFPIPSLGLCMGNNDSNIRVLKLINSMALSCEMQGQVHACKDIFYIFYANREVSCMLTHSFDGSDALSQESDWKIKYNGSMTTDALVKSFGIWVGDLNELAGGKPLKVTFDWNTRTTVKGKYLPFRNITENGLCHEVRDTLIECPVCHTASTVFLHPYECCPKEYRSVIVPDMTKHYFSYPCSHYAYITYAFIDTYHKDYSMAEFTLSKTTSVLTTYLIQSRYSWKGMIVLLSTYWGFFVGCVVSELATAMLIFLIALMFLLKKLCGTENVSKVLVSDKNNNAFTQRDHDKKSDLL